MSLTSQQIEDIAALARLELTAEEKESYREQLSAILTYFDQLQQIDTEHVAVISQLNMTDYVLRNDEPQASLEKAKLFKNSPSIEKEQFKTPAVFKAID
ncbi:MAG: Asp-tRNA(Asn)/Glu-tRNA(Gln) amidotransferase subunit GatC [Anaerolineae bacterium]|nr:Asp-tRNA(Asn)/Glu-tRNA(Gln) amidotransferase subunit GatC [Anaerolineae bacterium]